MKGHLLASNLPCFELRVEKLELKVSVKLMDNYDLPC